MERAKTTLKAAPWLLGPTAILLAFTLSVIGDIVNTFEKTATTTASGAGISVLQTTLNELNGRDRVLQLFDFGSLVWAAVLLLGVALLIHRAGPVAPGVRPIGVDDLAAPERAARGLLANLFIVSSAAVAGAAVIDVIIWLSYLGDTTALALHSVLVDLGAAAVAAAAAAWAGTARTKPAGVASLGNPTATTPVPQAASTAPPVSEPTVFPRPAPGAPSTAPAPPTAPVPPPPWGPAPGAQPGDGQSDPDPTTNFTPPATGYPPPGG